MLNSADWILVATRTPPLGREVLIWGPSTGQTVMSYTQNYPGTGHTETYWMDKHGTRIDPEIRILFWQALPDDPATCD